MRAVGAQAHDVLEEPLVVGKAIAARLVVRVLKADAPGAAVADAFRAAQSGWYLQGVYQFMPHWRVGLRTERLSPGTPGYGINAALVGTDSGSPSKQTLMLDWNPSEFSRVRFQVAQDRARPGAADTQWLLQYQMSLGAHGAHNY